MKWKNHIMPLNVFHNEVIMANLLVALWSTEQEDFENLFFHVITPKETENMSFSLPCIGLAVH